MEITVGAAGGISDQNGPIIVCVGADALMLERVRRQLAGVGQVVTCADLDLLREMLFPSPAVESVCPGMVAGPDDVG